MCLLIAKEGLQDKQIAARLRKANGRPLSSWTVRNYISALFMKLSVDSREGVIIWAFRSGLVKVGR